MAIDQSVPRSRRALLAAGLGGLGASILHALGRPTPAAAADGDPLVLGTTANASSALTELQHNHATNDAFKVSMASSSTGSAIHAMADNGSAILASNSSAAPAVAASNIGNAAEPGPAIYAVAGGSGSGLGPAVRATVHAIQIENVYADATAILAQATGTVGVGVHALAPTIGVMARNTENGTAILGISGGNIVTPASKIGIYGYANQDANARAVYGKSLVGTGVWGNSDTGRGLFGRSTSGTGVSAQSDTGRAMYGTTGAADKTAILGQNTNGGGSGVQGMSGTGVPPAPEQETGVFGSANISTASTGVTGRSTGGAGVWGDTNTGVGVVATGQQVDSWGLYAAGGIAMVADGPTFFSESGKTTIASGSSATVAVPSGIGPDSIGFAVLMTNRAGIWVRAVTTNQTNGTITIYLNTNVPGSTTLGWYLIN